MFGTEAEMARPAVRWLQSLGLSVKREFITPWGICDLVALSFHKGRAKQRVRMGQTRPVGSFTRSLLLCSIPDERTGACVTVDRLVKEHAGCIPESLVAEHLERLIVDGFLIRHSRGRLQKRDGWSPVQKRIVAIELKLGRIEEAVAQAANNLAFADRSYVGLPRDVANRIAMNRSRLEIFEENEVGLLSVGASKCEVLTESRRLSKPDSILQFYCAEKFWRTFFKDN